MTDLIKRLREPMDIQVRKCEEYYEEERSEAADALERMQWNPDMAAAPKDGTLILVYSPRFINMHGDSGGGICEASYKDYSTGWKQRMVENTIRKSPVWVGRLLGAGLYKHVG